MRASASVAASAARPPLASPRREDRWQSSAGVKERRRATLAMSVLVASVALHAALVATAWLSGPASPAPSREIAVEIVPDVPKTPEPPPGKASPPAEQKPKQAVSAPPPPAPASKPDADQKRQLREELAQLKAEQAALQAKRESARRAARRADPVEAEQPRGAGGVGMAAVAGLGPLPDSFQAVALPTTTSGEGEVVGYAALVFSQLAKAKKAGGELGVPGTTGVRFSIDDKGALVSVALVVSSGIKALDEEAIAIVRRAAPFPQPPKDAQRDFTANVSFVAGARG